MATSGRKQRCYGIFSHIGRSSASISLEETLDAYNLSTALCHTCLSASFTAILISMSSMLRCARWMDTWLSRQTGTIEIAPVIKLHCCRFSEKFEGFKYFLFCVGSAPNATWETTTKTTILMNFITYFPPRLTSERRLLADNGSTTRLSKLIRTFDGKSRCTLAPINREAFLRSRQIRRSHARHYSKAADQNRTVQFVG